MNQPEDNKKPEAGQVAIQISDLPEKVRDIATTIGLSATLKISRMYGGDAIYFPKYQTLVREVRDRVIKAEFNGSNYRELARKFNLTPSTIRQIMRRF